MSDVSSVCVPERLCPHCLLCLSMTQHLSEASCQFAAFDQIVVTKGKCHKKMKARQKFIPIKQRNYLIVFVLLFCEVSCCFFFVVAVFSNKKKKN